MLVRHAFETARASGHELFRSRLLFLFSFIAILAVTLIIIKMNNEQYETTFILEINTAARSELEKDHEFYLSEIFTSDKFQQSVRNNETLSHLSIDSLIEKIQVSYHKDSNEIVFLTTENDPQLAYQILLTVQQSIEINKNNEVKELETEKALSQLVISERQTKKVLRNLKKQVSDYEDNEAQGLLQKSNVKLARLEDSIDQVTVDLNVLDTKVAILNEQLKKEGALQTSLSHFRELQKERDILHKQVLQLSNIVETQKIAKSKLTIDSSNEFSPITQKELRDVEAEIKSNSRKYKALRTKLRVVEAEIEQFQLADGLIKNPNTASSLLYDQLRQQISLTEVEKQTLQQRKIALNHLLNQERALNEALLLDDAKLRSLNDDEKNLELELSQFKEKKSTLIQESEKLRTIKDLFDITKTVQYPEETKGFSSRQLWVAGGSVSLAFPLIMSLFIVMFDTRIRSKHEVLKVLPESVRILSEIPHYQSPAGFRAMRGSAVFFVLLVSVVMSVYIYIGWLQLM